MLEIGAGIGNVSLHLMPRTRYTATDINPHYLRYLASLAPGRPYLEVQELNLEDRQGFEKQTKTFDTVVCLNVLEHVPDETAALTNIFIALQPGGRAGQESQLYCPGRAAAVRGASWEPRRRLGLAVAGQQRLWMKTTAPSSHSVGIKCLSPQQTHRGSLL